ncbi:MAG: transcriptional regulator [Nitrospirales bacterium]|nr:MAG: transcriptional regulator [Nitrospirales bacterium]
MSGSSWKPTRVGATGTDGNAAGKVVELAITTAEVKKAIEDQIRADGEFTFKQPGETQIPHLLILEIDEDPEKTFSLVKTVLGSAKGTEIFLTSAKTDSAILLEAMRAGMKEFLPQPIQPDEVTAALERFKVRNREVVYESKKPAGKVIALFGGKGGTGTTSVAVNLAASLHLGKHKPAVVLVDVNQHGGDIPLYLDLPTTHSFRDIAADLTRVDLAFLASVLTKHESGVHVLPSGYDDLSAGRLNPDCIEPTIKLLQSMFEFVVIDCGHVLDLTTKKALELSSSIMVVSSLMVPAVHRTKRILELLRGSGVPQDKIDLVITRYLPHEKDVLNETNDILKQKANWLLPNDYAASSNAINSGKPVVMIAPRSSLTRTYRQLADSFLGQTSVPQTGSFWGSLMKSVKGKRTSESAAPA